VLAWESGLPVFDDARMILRGSIMGAIFAAVTQKLAFVTRSLQLSAEETAAHRLADVFRDALGRHRRDPRPPPPPPPRDPRAKQTVAWAYETLRVDPTASDDEVNRAWRDLRREHHPDRAASDPEEFARRSQYSSDLNAAREVIRAHRSGARHRAAS